VVSPTPSASKLDEDDREKIDHIWKSASRKQREPEVGHTPQTAAMLAAEQKIAQVLQLCQILLSLIRLSWWISLKKMSLTALGKSISTTLRIHFKLIYMITV
jgi:hypothetical protein